MQWATARLPGYRPAIGQARQLSPAGTRNRTQGGFNARKAMKNGHDEELACCLAATAWEPRVLRPVFQPC